MKTDQKQVQEDNIAAIGIGAMIVFIAFILVAAVVVAVII
jgi:archaellin